MSQAFSESIAILLPAIIRCYGNKGDLSPASALSHYHSLGRESVCCVCQGDAP